MACFSTISLRWWWWWWWRRPRTTSKLGNCE